MATLDRLLADESVFAIASLSIPGEDVCIGLALKSIDGTTPTQRAVAIAVADAAGVQLLRDDCGSVPTEPWENPTAWIWDVKFGGIRQMSFVKFVSFPNHRFRRSECSDECVRTERLW